MSKSQEVQREPWSVEKDITDVEERFQFNEPTPAQKAVIAHIENWGKSFALELASLLPEGNAKQVAIGNVMSAVLWAKQSLTHRSVEIGVCGCPAGEKGAVGEPGQCCERDHDHEGNCDIHPERK